MANCPWRHAVNLERDRLLHFRVVIALPEVAERQHKQHDRDDAIERGDRHEAAAVATAKHRTEESDKRNREGGGDEAADVTAEHAERIGVVALDRVGGEIRKNRCDRRLDAGIDSTAART